MSRAFIAFQSLTLVASAAVAGVLWAKASGEAPDEKTRWAGHWSSVLVRDALTGPASGQLAAVDKGNAAFGATGPDGSVLAEFAVLLGKAESVVSQAKARQSGGTLDLAAAEVQPIAESGLWAVAGEIGALAGGAKTEPYFAVIDKVCKSNVDPACWQLVDLVTGEEALAYSLPASNWAVAAAGEPAKGESKLPDRETAAALLAEATQAAPAIKAAALPREAASDAVAVEAPAETVATDAMPSPAESQQTASLQAGGEGDLAAPQTEASGPELLRQIQIGLNALGYDAGPEDGQIGPRTREAIQRYQEDNALPVDGRPNVGLLAKIALDRSRRMSTKQRQNGALSVPPDEAPGQNPAADASDPWEVALPAPPDPEAEGPSPVAVGSAGVVESGQIPPSGAAADSLAETEVPASTRTQTAAPGEGAELAVREVATEIGQGIRGWFDRITVTIDAPPAEPEVDVATVDGAAPAATPEALPTGAGNAMAPAAPSTGLDAPTPAVGDSAEVKPGAAEIVLQETVPADPTPTDSIAEESTEARAGAVAMDIAAAIDGSEPADGSTETPAADDGIATAARSLPEPVSDGSGRDETASATEVAALQPATDIAAESQVTEPATLPETAAENPEAAVLETEAAASDAAQETPNTDAESIAKEPAAQVYYDQRMVLRIQNGLNAMGFDAGREDGWMGPRTGSAIAAYQRSHGLADDGVPSLGLLAHLTLERTRAAPIATAAAPDTTTAAVPATTTVSLDRQDAESSAPETAAAAPVAEAKGARYQIQLGSRNSLLEAMQVSQRVREILGPLLKGASANFEHVNLGAEGTVYRTHYGPIEDWRQAEEACARVQTQKQSCVVVRESGNGTPANAGPAAQAAPQGRDQAVQAAPDQMALATPDLEDGVALAKAAVVLQRQGNAEQAIDYYSRAIASGDLAPESLAYAHNNRGAARKQVGLYELAIADYSRAVELKRNFARAYYNRGIALYGQGLDDLARNDYDQAILLKPGFAAAYHNRGHVHLRNGDAQRAIADYSRAIEQAPTFDTAYFSRGEAYESIGELDRAAADFERAYALDAANPLYRAKLAGLSEPGQSLGALSSN